MSIKILAISTVVEACSVALLNKGTIHTRFERTNQKNSNYVLLLINDLLQVTNCEISDIDVIAFCIGPGNFTGIRIGINVAQGLAIGRNLKMIGISTLKTLAQGAIKNNRTVRRVLTAIDARMGEIYWAEYELNNNDIWFLRDLETILSPNSAIERMHTLNGEWITAGNGWKIYPNLYKGHQLSLNPLINILPLAEDMISLARIDLKNGNFTKLEHIKPVYLRDKIT
ncbi:tRNA (adenosine(37)-N6)-threonylcarbamoyltransferase complex dimerization subunit type 1 TsaB [Candidatus Pantoea edessiphila]|uniref:tRNA threonylcarbamoyladenosine biosynthesis protein TsaB n=1 Tax=Candidatus Pantoea edessiphila TaxID=2044610 RepID=A0A2P5T0R2_9GAMM|nr:tRNA (adenosine(37)-N6)-threonylcarbamoyltransferase complex dimerization subunit type 1 TsaB [Candidatus Pantoea edessiphila]PPI88178.1 tRNA (adenosine(37)-N6)-threonylcarbamoyltransferase complex dimerization subunit type 1 TsaB [Candidatus Pantoea edessiphila]